MKKSIIILILALFITDIVSSAGIRESMNKSNADNAAFAAVYEKFRDAFPGTDVLTTNKYRSNFISISIEDMARNTAGKFSDEEIQALILIFKQTEDDERDIFLRHFNFMIKNDLTEILKDLLIFEYSDGIFISLLEYVYKFYMSSELRAADIHFRLFELNPKIAEFLWNWKEENSEILTFTLEGEDYKLINGIVYCYVDYLKVIPMTEIYYDDGHYFIIEYSEERRASYESPGSLPASLNYYRFAREYELKNGELVPKYIPNISKDIFNAAPAAFYYRFMIENSRNFEEADLAEIKEMDGMFFYWDKEKEEARPFRSVTGLYKTTQNNKEVYYLNGNKQVVHNGQLIPQEFFDKTNEPGAVVFSYANMWINVKPVTAAIDEPYIDPVKTIYAADKDGKTWYFQNGECLSNENTNLTVDPEYAMKIEGFSDRYNSYLLENPQPAMTQDEKDAINNGLFKCRLLMRQWRDNLENKQFYFDEIDNILTELQTLF